MARRLHAAIALVVVEICCGGAFAQGGHVLQGRVVLPNNAPPANPVKVTLTFSGARVFETFTDLSGRFSFNGLKRGTYQLTAEGDGEIFETTTVYADVAAFGNAPQVFTQNIQLRLKAGKKTLPAGVVSVEEMDPNVPDAARKEYQKGMKDADEERPGNAIRHFREAIKLYPALYAAHLALGDQQAKLQRNDEAIESYKNAIDLKPDKAAPYVGLGVTLVKQKRYNDAIAPLAKSLDIEKQSSISFLFLGIAEFQTGDVKGAEANLLRSYEIGKQPLAAIYLADIYEQRGEIAKAIERLETYLRDNPQDTRSEQVRMAIEKLKKKLPH